MLLKLLTNDNSTFAYISFNIYMLFISIGVILRGLAENWNEGVCGSKSKRKIIPRVTLDEVVVAFLFQLFSVIGLF